MIVYVYCGHLVYGVIHSQILKLSNRNGDRQGKHSKIVRSAHAVHLCV